MVFFCSLFFILVDSQDYRSWLRQTVGPKQPLHLFCGNSSVLGKCWSHEDTHLCIFYLLNSRQDQLDVFIFLVSRLQSLSKDKCTRSLWTTGALELWYLNALQDFALSYLLGSPFHGNNISPEKTEPIMISPLISAVAYNFFLIGLTRPA